MNTYWVKTWNNGRLGSVQIVKAADKLSALQQLSAEEIERADDILVQLDRGGR